MVAYLRVSFAVARMLTFLLSTHSGRFVYASGGKHIAHGGDTYLCSSAAKARALFSTASPNAGISLACRSNHDWAVALRGGPTFNLRRHSAWAQAPMRSERNAAVATGLMAAT